ncbi:sensor histidine kinase [Sulfurimonas paralvinellae]|uniref:histidine kinase n=1 Tax=Sulfurimonas paralvinellae TaxID=317658 RepID=A0A7M1B559_9BACT|nr:HAMP domain-containing sensor histidine kinase [Sulfurimonas paralvinellae]QOP44800.1 HAMP domain-containing histidine kinase [Sulfurimonas paralvinellae]
MKKVEKESLIKSFLLFFISQSLLIGALFIINYEKEVQTLDEQIFSQMRICSFNLQCSEYDIDFVPKDKHELYKLYKNSEDLSSYFTIPGSQKNYLKIYLPKKQYDKKIAKLREKSALIFLSVLLVIALLSALFALYALSPLRNALHLTEEFIKDILHDFNTPLSTLRLNISILANELGENKNIKRAQNAVQNILNLQANLRAYLHSHASQKEEFALDEFVRERVELIAIPFRDITVEVDVPALTLFTNKDAFTRIFDNLLSNALKYNKQKGKVFVRYEKGQLIIEDTGKGIKNPSKVFERFYKEQARGIGIGLHIVKKLCEELGIEISLTSKIDKGSSFYLNLQKLEHR